MFKIIPILFLIAIVATMQIVATTPISYAQVTDSSNYPAPECVICVPGWIKNNAGWWADGTIDDKSFVSGIQWLVSNEIIEVPSTTVAETANSAIPDWVKNTAGWWADDIISDDDFVNSIQYLIKTGIMVVPQAEKPVAEKSTIPTNADPNILKKIEQAKYDVTQCKDAGSAGEIYLCESKPKKLIDILERVIVADRHAVGPMIFYYKPTTVEASPGGNSLLTINLIVHNTSNENQSMFCTGPAACNFTVNDGKKSYIYSSNDITAGRAVLKPDTFLTVQFFFGPAMAKQYDSFEYDPSKEYFLNINESYGNYDLPLKLTLKQ